MNVNELTTEQLDHLIEGYDLERKTLRHRLNDVERLINCATQVKNGRTAMDEIIGRLQSAMDLESNEKA